MKQQIEVAVVWRNHVLADGLAIFPTRASEARRLCIDPLWDSVALNFGCAAAGLWICLEGSRHFNMNEPVMIDRKWPLSPASGSGG